MITLLCYRQSSPLYFKWKWAKSLRQERHSAMHTTVGINGWRSLEHDAKNLEKGFFTSWEYFYCEGSSVTAAATSGTSQMVLPNIFTPNTGLGIPYVVYCIVLRRCSWDTKQALWINFKPSCGMQMTMIANCMVIKLKFANSCILDSKASW